jgi:hypothetical protein
MSRTARAAIVEARSEGSRSQTPGPGYTKHIEGTHPWARGKAPDCMTVMCSHILYKGEQMGGAKDSAILSNQQFNSSNSNPQFNSRPTFVYL